MEKSEPITALQSRVSPLIGVAAFFGGILAAAWSLSLLAATLLHVPAIYRAETKSVGILLSSLHCNVQPALLLAAWIPVAICVLAFAIVVGGLLIVNLTPWVQQVLAEINRLTRVCPTVPWFGFPWNKATCYAQLAALLALVTAALGVFFIAAAVVLINVIVIIMVAVGAA
jgi:hypothetical protein